MAGGRDWTLEEKADEDETFTLMNDDEVRHFRAEKIVFEISTPVAVEQVTLGRGDKGKVSGFITCAQANVVKTRTLPSGRYFLCTADNIRKIQTASRHYLRTQVWENIGKAEEYDPDTGQVL